MDNKEQYIRSNSPCIDLCQGAISDSEPETRTIASFVTDVPFDSNSGFSQTTAPPLSLLERLRANFAWENLYKPNNAKERNSAGKIDERQIENLLLTDESVNCCVQFQCKCGKGCMDLLRASVTAESPDKTEIELKNLVWIKRSQVLKYLQVKELRAKYVASVLYNSNQELYKNFRRKHGIPGDCDDTRMRVPLRVDGVDVCKEVFCNVHGISLNTLKVAKKHAKNPLIELKKQCNVEFERVVKSDGAFRVKVTTMKDWLLTYAKDGSACQMPTSSGVYDDTEPISTEYRLYNNTKLAIWQIYFGDIECTEARPLSYSHFCCVWRNDEYLKKNIRLMRKTENFGKCGLCEAYKSKLCTRLGKVERAECRSEYSIHLRDMKYERQKYMKHVSKAIRKPSEFMSVCIDGMGTFATTLPHLNISSAKDIKGKDRLETQIVGVLVHGARMDFYGITGAVKHGPEVTVECLDRSIRSHLKDLESQNKPTPRVLYIQLDNTTKDNKCETVLDYCAYLVHASLFDKVKVSFLKPGHTHIDIDQRFSVINRYLKSLDSNAVTWPRMQTAIRVAFLDSDMKVTSVTMVLELNDWTTLLRASCQKIRRFAKEDTSGEAQHVFVFYVCQSSEDAVEVRMVYKEWNRSRLWRPKPYELGDEVETTDGTMARVKSIARAETPTTGVFGIFPKNKKYEYEFTATDVSGNDIVWQEASPGILILNEAVDVKKMKLAPIPENWGRVLDDVEKTILYLEANKTNALHANMMSSNVSFDRASVLRDYGDGSFDVRIIGNQVEAYVDSERIRVDDVRSGFVEASLKYPSAFVWWKRFISEQRDRIKDSHLRQCLTITTLDARKLKRRRRGEVLLEVSEIDEGVTAVDSVTHEGFTNSQRKSALMKQSAELEEDGVDNRPQVGEICIAAVTSEEQLNSRTKRYSRETCPCVVRRHCENPKEFEVSWYYNRQDEYKKNQVWSQWKEKNRNRPGRVLWVSTISQESILMRRVVTCSVKPASLRIKTGSECVDIESFKLTKACAEEAQRLEESFSKATEKIEHLEESEDSSDQTALSRSTKRRRILSSSESESD